MNQPVEMMTQRGHAEHSTSRAHRADPDGTGQQSAPRHGHRHSVPENAAATYPAALGLLNWVTRKHIRYAGNGSYRMKLNSRAGSWLRFTAVLLRLTPTP